MALLHVVAVSGVRGRPTQWQKVVFGRSSGCRRRRRRQRVGWVVGTVALTGVLAVTLDLRPGLGAVNAVAPSNADVVTLDVRPPVLPPGPPTSVVAVAGNRSLEVSWHAPVDDGGAPVLAYEAVSDPRGGSCSVAAPGTSCVIDGLNNGQFFTVTVRAVNPAGVGPPSVPSDPVRPRPN